MRRIALSLTVMAIAVLMSTTVALAATINCPYSGTCYGTSYADTLYGGNGNNTMYGYGSNDNLYGSGGNDWIYGGYGNDYLSGGNGDDYLSGQAGSDRYVGWYGNDRMYDVSSYSSDTYFGLTGGGNDVILDYGGTSDVLNLSHLARSEVLITWVDTSDSDTNLDALRVEQKGVNNTVLVRNYFDNSGGLGKGSGAIESIEFNDKTVGLPASEG